MRVAQGRYYCSFSLGDYPHEVGGWLAKNALQNSCFLKTHPSRSLLKIADSGRREGGGLRLVGNGRVMAGFISQVLLGPMAKLSHCLDPASGFLGDWVMSSHTQIVQA